MKLSTNPKPEAAEDFIVTMIIVFVVIIIVTIMIITLALCSHPSSKGAVNSKRGA
jgi:flagellar basal body-associated protein FliL